MAQKKQRVFQHIMEDDSYQIVKENLPREWVIRDFNRPDYGIDLVIELFEKINNQSSETLGEFLYVQVKSVKELKIKKEKVFPVGNVSKGFWREDQSEYMEIDVVKFILDTNSIFSVQSLGASISFILFVVDINTRNVYFICLNDYIDKILLPKNPNYLNQNAVTITIPVQNNLRDTIISRSALEFYGKRSKLLSAFSQFTYQKNELSYLTDYQKLQKYKGRDEISKEHLNMERNIIKQVSYFIVQIEHLEIWNYNSWEVLHSAKMDILSVKENLIEYEDFNFTIQKINSTWTKLANINNMYEELTREWFLPKFLSIMTSYPLSPEIKHS